MFNNLNNRDILYRFTLIGFFVGFFILFIAFLITVVMQNITLSSIGPLILNNPAYWILITLPVQTSILAYFFGKPIARNIIQSKVKLYKEVEKSEKVLEFLHSLIDEDTEIEYKFDDQYDKLGQALITLRDNIKQKGEDEQHRRKEDQQRSWVAEGLAKFNDILRSDNDNLEVLSYNIISGLVKYLKANQGGFFILSDGEREEQYFQQTACFAYDRKKYSEKTVQWDEGLIGMSAHEMKTIFMTDIPDTYLNITSGLGEATPKSLLIVPLIVNDEVHGVLELASFKVFEEHEITFVEKIAESIAATISSVKINVRTANLLKESQDQAETLASQEEQMRQNMEELQATQEEAARQAEKFVSFTNSVNHTLIRAEYATDGTLLYANTKFLKKLGYNSNTEVEGKHISLFINEKDRIWFDPIWDTLSKGGRHFEGYMKHVTKQGQDLWTMATYTCVRKEDNSVEKILFLAIDTTEQKKQSLDYEGQIEALNLTNIKIEAKPDGAIIDVNDLFLETLKYTKEEILIKNVFSFIDKQELEGFAIVWKKVKDGKAYEGIIKVITNTGEEKWFRISLNAVHDMYGEIAKIIFLANDITKEKLMEIEALKYTEQLKEQEEKLRQAGDELAKKLDEARMEMKLQYKEIEKVKIRNERTLEGALDAIISISDSGKIDFFNRTAETLWGIPRKEALGKDVKILFSEDTITNDDFVARYTDPSREKIVGERREVKITTKSGEDKPVLFLISEAKVDNEKTYTAFIQNIEVELF
ncbi:MAG: PAS domain S-box protein [Bacteroidales bacterium]|nr:PAS domain S-box protein [Bacteroidales bacterium]